MGGFELRIGRSIDRLVYFIFPLTVIWSPVASPCIIRTTTPDRTQLGFGRSHPISPARMHSGALPRLFRSQTLDIRSAVATLKLRVFQNDGVREGHASSPKNSGNSQVGSVLQRHLSLFNHIQVSRALQKSVSIRTVEISNVLLTKVRIQQASKISYMMSAVLLSFSPQVLYPSWHPVGCEERLY